MKRILVFLVLAAMIFSVPVRAEDGRSRVVIGADLTDAEAAAVYETFGIERGSAAELTMTNEREREYLEGSVPEEMLGGRSISCVYITLGADEPSVAVHNIDWCTEAMYLSAMSTAGIEDAAVVVAAPFPVSGTAGLAGIFLAYEDMTGQTLSDSARQAAALELVTAGELAGEMGSAGALTMITELKLMLEEIRGLSDEQLVEKIDALADDYNIPLNDYQREKLIDFCRSIEDLDPDFLTNAAGTVKDTLKDLGEFKDKALSVWEAIVEFFAAIAEFISSLFSIFA